MRMLVVNADDLGLSRGISDGILEAHTEGIVTSASLMVSAAGAEDAVRAAADHAQLSLGLHFVDDDSDLEDPVVAARSFNSQLERFRALVGRGPTHVDSHHHVHSASPRRRAVFAELVEPLGVPLRGQSEVPYVGAFWGQWQAGVTKLRHIQRPFLLQLIRTMVGEGLTEIGCHPGRVGDFSSSYLHERAVELATLTEAGLREEIAALGVELASFAAFAELPGGPGGHTRRTSQP
jgi:chitin disaccharide deacetylase